MSNCWTECHSEHYVALQGRTEKELMLASKEIRVHELVAHAPARLTVEVQFALCRILNCTPADLWQDLGQVAMEHTPEPAARERMRKARVVRAGELL